MALRYCFLLSIGISLFLTSSVSAQTGSASNVASLYSKEGIVEGKLVPASAWKEIEQGQEFAPDDMVRVGKHGRAGVLFVDGTMIRLNKLSSVRFRPLNVGTGTTKEISIDSGEAHILHRQTDNFPTISTPIVSAAIRGTEIAVRVSADETVVTVIDGAVACQNEFGSVQAGSGEQVITRKGQAPVKQILVNPLDAVQWALYYPVDLFVSDLPKTYQPIVAEFQNGKIAAALDRLDGMRAKDAGSEIYASGFYAAAGEVDTASALLSKYTNSLDSLSSSEKAAYYRTAAVIDLVNNRKDEALAKSNVALSEDPEGFGSLVVGAYVAQAYFDLERSRELLSRAVNLYPHEPFGYARLAEIELGFGRVEVAEQLVLDALRLNSDYYYGTVVLGFIQLFKQEKDRAIASFQKAIGLQSYSGLPHLGLGLVTISRGDLGTGRIELQKAVHLEPRSGLFRSYLGKAFFEEEKEQLAGEEFENAIELDPKDPTPYLYRAFNKLSQNQTVSALRDVEKSIALNDQRAVYRSRLLLDRDLGTRSAGLAQVFNDLGFREAARVEAIKSLNKDYSNYSAHRLLSESYDTVQLADARFSERKLSELLAPLSFNLFNSVGGEASLNDYNALFDKNEQRTGVNTSVDNRDTLLSGEVYRTGKTDTFGYYASYQNIYGDGSKDASYLRDNRLRFAAQYQPTYTDRIIVDADYLYRDRRDDGNIPEDFQSRDWRASLGYHRRLSERSKAFAEVAYEYDNGDTSGLDLEDALVQLESRTLEPFEFSDELFINRKQDEDLHRLRFTAQHIFDSTWVSSVFGAQLAGAFNDRQERVDIIDDIASVTNFDDRPYGVFTDLDRSFQREGDNDLRSADGYSYLTGHVAPWMDVTAGGTYSYVEFEKRDIPPFVDGTFKSDRFNPKIGVALYPHDWVLVRAAYFENLRKSALEDQISLEPTLVGGMNQRFTDNSGVKSKNFGFGVDAKVPGVSYFGAEATDRRLYESFASAASEFTFDFDALSEDLQTVIEDEYTNRIDQQIAKAYWYQILTSRLVSTVDYLYTKDELDVPDLLREFETHKNAIGLQYIDPTGVFLFGRTTWRQQDRTGSAFFEDGISDFWLLDLGVGYRLPERKGRIQVEVTNVLDEDFNYDGSLRFERAPAPEIGVTLLASINF